MIFLSKKWQNYIFLSTEGVDMKFFCVQEESEEKNFTKNKKLILNSPWRK